MPSVLVPGVGWVVLPDIVDERLALPRLTPDQIAAVNIMIAAGSNEYPTGTEVVRSSDEVVLTKQGIGTSGAFRVADSASAPERGSDAWLQLYAALPDAIAVGALPRNSDGAVTTFAVVWPDGTPGTYTSLVFGSGAGLGAVDSYQVTYGSPALKTATQPVVTRDSVSGAASVRPSIVIT